MVRRLLWSCVIFLLLLSVSAHAERKVFFNLTASQVRADSILPQFTYSIPLAGDWRDSIYTVSLAYPEFIEMEASDVAAYNHISGAPLPELPSVVPQLATNRQQGSLVVSFCPYVFRNNRYQILVSFMLRVEAKAKSRSVSKLYSVTRASSLQQRYAPSSVLATGNWAKIRVPSTGVYQLTEDIIRRAGFTDINKVKIYGYGGALQPEKLDGGYLASHDDLKEVAQCVIGSKHLFYAQGPVSWSDYTTTIRTRNPYSNYGYYLITQSEEPSLKIDSVDFLQSFYPSPNDYHRLYEVDGYSWYHGGRNLFDPEEITSGRNKQIVFANPQGANSGKLYVKITASSENTSSVWVNGTCRGQLKIKLSSYDKANEASAIYDIDRLSTSDTILIKNESGGPIRLDYVSMSVDKPLPAPNLSSVRSTPEYVYNITNQNHHADAQANMVIIIPTSQKLLTQAQRLKAFHESHDSLSVNIVAADELYNEFSSGTPDVNAYRRYLKMLYDRAEGDEHKMPKYLLLLGDCVWDNRMLTSDCHQLNADDYLLCYESENSYNEVICYVDDSWIGLLDDGEGKSPTTELLDVAVGRIPTVNASDAKAVVDKIINYGNNKNAGNWQNEIMFMGDDGNENLHMADENATADMISSFYPGYVTKKVMWDAYTRETSSTGNTYPEVTRILKQQQAGGALVMDYAGHGSEIQLSHETILRISDFSEFKNKNLPLWVTASCDIMPFDGTSETIGEKCLLNKDGGSVAFYGTTRTVYANLNKYMNRAFLYYVLSHDSNGKPMTIGEAHRLAQNTLAQGGPFGGDRSENRLQYSLLGDPALALNLPSRAIKIDSVNGIDVNATDSLLTLKAGSIAKVSGHIENDDNFDGIVTMTVRDSKELVTCKQNDAIEASERFTYYDRTKTLFQGSDSIKGGRFEFTFTVPTDINYSKNPGLINVYAVNADHSMSAHGYYEKFNFGEGEQIDNDSVGPSIYCYLNSRSFVNGGDVNPTPYFVAELSDHQGINAAGNGIGHDLILIIDGDMSKTYVLNDHFTYDFGSYSSGKTFFSIPQLAPGRHTLQFRAWDVQNNSSISTLDFNVVNGLQPTLFDVSTTNNPVKTSTTFIINHDRTGSNMEVTLEVFDLAGRLLWKHHESGVPTTTAYTVDWDLTTDGGRRLGTGVYLYRAKIASDGSNEVSKAKKLIVVSNN